VTTGLGGAGMRKRVGVTTDLLQSMSSSAWGNSSLHHRDQWPGLTTNFNTARIRLLTW